MNGTRHGRPRLARTSLRLRRSLPLALVLVVAALVVPPSAVRTAPASLLRVHTAQAVARSPHVTWILCLGSDARPGEPVLRSRADAIQLVGINTRTGAATAIGVPRDSFVPIPGHGRNKINASMYYGGPRLMARSVGRLVGIRPDYVFTAGFMGFVSMVHTIGGVTVHARHPFSEPIKHFHVGRNRVNGLQALAFARERKQLPRGDFDRSADQQALLVGILREVRAHADRPGFVERALLSVTRNLNTDLRPAELFRLAQAATQIRPGRFRTCVVTGGTGYVGGASVVFPNVAQAHRIARRVRNDATLNGSC